MALEKINTQSSTSSQSEASAVANPPLGGGGASFWQASWRRLKKNTGAMIGLVMIVIAVLLVTG
jgi:hypothetical protein